ncbi:hypothetical protein BaRGS_00015389 [Batillaria attramentaria]|uniref:Uncharacterized protein n=1 Tax=Batillaria attramentaria TaxID=370345 RepID=A0ABD0L221_9CAEN
MKTLTWLGFIAVSLALCKVSSPIQEKVCAYLPKKHNLTGRKAEVGRPCTSKDQCAADECCQIVNIVVVSRRRQALQPLAGPNTSGTCEKYKKQGEWCTSFEVLNGYCGCEEGLTCQAVHLSQPSTLRKGVPSQCLP